MNVRKRIGLKGSAVFRPEWMERVEIATPYGTASVPRIARSLMLPAVFVFLHAALPMHNAIQAQAFNIVGIRDILETADSGMQKLRDLF